MAHTIAGSNAYHAGILVPDDGDPAVAASVDTAFQMLVDNDTYLNTQLAHQSADDRGTTHTISGPIVWNDGGGSFNVQVDSNFGGSVDLTSDVVIHSSGGLINAGSTDLRGLSTSIGGSATSSLVINSTTQQYGPIFYHDVAQFGHPVTITSTLEVDDDVDLQGTTQLATVDISDTLTVAGDTTINSTFRVRASTHIGNSSTNNHEFTGGVSFDQGIAVAGDATVNGTLTLNGSGNNLGSSASVGTLEATGNVTLGNSSSDTITTNGTLASPLTYAGSGRVLNRLSLLPNANTSITTSSGNMFYANNGLSADRTFTLQNTGAQDGDWAWFTNTSSVNVIVTGSGGTIGRTITPASSINPTWAWWAYSSSFGGWLLMAHS